MTLLEFFDRMGERRIERMKLSPPRPRDTRMVVGTLFFMGYYILVYSMLKSVIPQENAPLVRDSLLVLGPVVGAIGSALFRTDVKDEIAAANTGTAFRALGKQADATKAAADSIPNAVHDGVTDAVAAAQAADAVVDGAKDAAISVKSGALPIGSTEGIDEGPVQQKVAE